MRKRDDGPSLFDLVDEVPDGTTLRDVLDCKHAREVRSTKVWDGETKERLTMTCVDCGRTRGRYPGE